MNAKARDNRSGNLLKGLIARDGSGVFIILVLFIVVMSVLTQGKFLSGNNITNLLRSISVLGVMSCAITLVMITGNIDLSVGSLLSLCACVAATKVENGLFLAIAIPMLVGLGAGLINGLLVGNMKLNPFIITLGMLSVYKAFTLIYANNRYLVPTENAAFQAIGQGYFLHIPIPVWIFLVVAVVYHIILKNTVFGTHVYSVGSNPVSSRFSGISSVKTVLASYMLAGMTTGLSGIILCSTIMSAQAQLGNGYEFNAVTAIVLGGVSIAGGKGTIPGTVMGVVFLGVLQNGFTLIGIPSAAQYIIQGIILIVALRLDSMKAGGRA